MVNYKRNGEEMFSGINIVPFTDIVLVLLIIFMIAAPGIVSTGLDVTLPGASSSSSRVPTKLTVALDKQGRIVFQGRIVSPDGLRLRVREMAARNKKVSIVLNADTTSRHGKVIQILDILRSSGAKNIYVGTVRE